ncbi:hypothetical protein [Streptomyces sp. NL15-2K]|uniref:hypothetical protein n=1 Tax=Streptomyces sp. NL15-2K TaxID=376149 RepID=UPI000F579570|nr:MULTISPECIES: hypothetical protein [Actinomycetes]WKX06598.1 hypothetical protein Q4V64_03450 [Kutzneria buriramensis]GCB43614.1 hypothetical protein SNL152K_899 [Streptomyces sp. NL15-2K]
MNAADPRVLNSLEDPVASPDDWNKVGYDGNPVSGNPDVLDDVAVDLRGLERLAIEVDVGLAAMLRTSENGGFEGETADALRAYVKDELRTFMLHVRTSFQAAGSAVERYAKALRESQGKAAGAARRAGEVAIPPAGIVGKNAPPPPELTAARNDVAAEVDFIETEAKILEEALDSARDLVTRPVKKIKKSFWKKFEEVLWKTLEVLSIVVSIVAVIFGGPLGLVALGLATVLFVKAVVDFAMGKLDALGLGLAFLGILFPSTKGLTSFTRAMQFLKTGGRLMVGGAGRGASALGRTLLQGGKLLLSPRTFASVVGQNLLSVSRATGRFVFSAIPRGAATTWRVGRDVATSMWRQFTGGLGRDFARTTGFLGSTSSRTMRLSVFATLALPRVLAHTLLPLTYFEIAKFGWRGAVRMGVLERGLGVRPSTVQSLSRTGSGVGDITSLRGKDPVPSGSGGALDDMTTPHLVVPGTPAWDDAMDGLNEIAARPPVTSALPSSMSSLPRTSDIPGGMPRGAPGRVPVVPDDLLERMALNDLDASGSRWGNVFQRQSLDTLGTFHGGPVPTQLFRNLVDDLDQLGAPLQPGRGPLLLEAPDNAVTRLRELDDVLGLERTTTGLLKPFDDVSDLASLSIDGKLGGLTETQLLKILDGEIDLVNVTPDGMILRIGKTDPVDVQVSLKDEVTIRVLEPQESGAGLPPLMTRMTDSPARLGIGLDDLARLIPDSTGGMRQIREVLGMSPARTDLAVKPVTPPQTGFPPLTLREIITGGEVGKIGADRFEAWVRLQNAEINLDTAGRELTRLTQLPDAPPLSRAQAELDLNAAELNRSQVRMDLGSLGMNLDTVSQDITSMLTRFDGPPATLPNTTPVTSAVTGDLPVGPVAHGLDGAAGSVDNIRLVDTVKAGFEVKPASVELRTLANTNAALPSAPLNAAGRELPLLGTDLGPPAQVRLVVTTPPPGATLTGKTFELIGASDITGSLKIAPTEGILAGRLPNGFTLTDLANNRFHFDEARNLVYRDVPNPDGAGFLRHTEGAAPGTEPVRLDEQGRLTSLFRFEAGAGPEPGQAPAHWLVRQDSEFTQATIKSGMKTRLTDDGLVPANLDGSITPLQAVSTANAKAFKENNPFTAFSPPGNIVKSYGNQEIGLDLIALRKDIAAGAEHVRNVEILPTTKVQENILNEIRLKTGEPRLDVPSTFSPRTSNKEIQEFLTQNASVSKGMATKITADIKALIQVRQDSTWLIKGAIPAKYLTGPYATADSLKFVPAPPTTPLAASTDVLESAGRASGSAAGGDSLQLTLKSDDFYMSEVQLDDLRGVKLVRQDNFFTTAVDAKGLRKSHFDPDVGIVPANPEGRTTALQHVTGSENAARKSNSPFTSFAVVGSPKIYGDLEVTLDVFKLGQDIKAGRVQNVAILPAHDLRRLISEQIELTIKKRLDFHSALTGDSPRQDVLAFLKNNDVNLVGKGGKDLISKISSDVRVLLNTSRDQEWLIKGVIPKSYLEGPYPRATAPAGTGDALSAANQRAMWIRDHHPQAWREFTGGSSPVDLHASAPSAPADSALPTPEPRLDVSRVPNQPLRLTDGGNPTTDLTTLHGSRGLPPVQEVPGSTVREVPLSGVGDLRGLAIRSTEIPASELGPASVRMEVVDLTAPGGPVRLPDATVTARESGGFTLMGRQGGVRWQLDSGGHLEFRELPLNGTDFSLRFDMGGSHAMPQVVGKNGLPVPGSTVIPPARDASGAINGLTTVRVPLAGTGTDALHGVFRFDGNSMLRQQELPLTLPGLDGPSGLGVKVTVTPGAGGSATKTFELTGPPHLTGAFKLAPTDSALAGRLPGGFTVTDTITSSRFHFDADGRLAFRDLPARDGSGFVRLTDGAAPGTPPLRLDELGGVPEGLPGGGSAGGIADIFQRTLDEATGTPRASDAPAVDLPLTRLGELDDLSGTGTPRTSSVSNLDDLPELDDAAIRAALEEHWQLVDDYQRAGGRFADEATAPLSRFGLGQDLPDDPLRRTTAQAPVDLRQGAATALREYLSLPPATRLEDMGSGVGRTFGDFTVTPTPHGGPGGSHYTVTHTPSDVVTGFGPDGERLYQEMLLSGGPGDLDGLRLGITGRSAEDGSWAPQSFEFMGARTADDTLTVTELAPTAPADLRGGFTVTDASGAVRWHYGPDGIHTVRDVQLPGSRGLFRFDADAPDGVPQVLDTAGRPSTALRVERLDDGRLALSPTGRAAQPLERAVFDARGTTLLEETLAIRGKGGRPTGEYWNIDHAAGKAVRTGADGTPFAGMFDIATVERSGTGQFRLTSTSPGKVTLFEREVLAGGNTLHVDVNRSGRARWTEFDSAGSRFRHGERIGDVDQRTFHDVPAGSPRLLNNVDVRMYTKALDGGLVRAEKGADGHWTWQRFDKGGAEVLSGDRRWSWNHVAFKDTFRDPVTGLDAVAQRRGQTWPFDGLHGSRMYQEHAVLTGHAPAGARVDPGDYTGQSPSNAQIERREALSDGGSLVVKRFADMRPPAFFWKGAAGRNPFEGFLRDLFGGESLNRVSFWTETAADGTKVTGVRLNPSGSDWVDYDQYGRLVRESRKLENGHVIEVGRSLEDPTRWAPVPEFRSGGSYELHWKDLTSGQAGTRHVDGIGRWRDLFTDARGIERVQLRSQGKGTREYLFDAPSTEDLRLHDDAGLWVDKNAQQHISGRRDLVDGRIVESSGSPYRTKWTWKAYDPGAPDTLVAEGIRKQNRGSIYTRPWDDSFRDFDLGGNLVRERNATDTGSSWIDAVKADDGSWKWTKRAADGTVHSEGVRVFDDVKTGRWRDLVDGHEVRRLVGDRVREFDYEIVIPEPPPTPSARLRSGTLRDLLDDSTRHRSRTLRDLLDDSARHFEAPSTVRVDPDVWKEYEAGKVFRESVAVDGSPGRYRLFDKQWGQWVELQNGHLVQWQTIDGRVWTTDAFGRLSASGPARLRQFLAGGLPGVGGEVGLPGSRGWAMIGREVDFRGMDVEIMGHLREMQDVWHAPFTGVRGGEVVEMPMWQRELRSGLFTFTTGFVTDFGANLAITAAVQNGDLKRADYLKALLSGGVGGSFNSGLTLLYNHTRLGWLRTSMGARDWGGHPNQTLTTQTDTWATEFSAQEKATRWRTATYANTFGVGTSALSAFVSNAISASVFGVNGHDTKGLDALVTGGWGALGALYGGVSTNLVRNGWHAAAGGRVFHKGGLTEFGVNLGESALSRYLTWLFNELDDNDGHFNLPNAGRSFPPSSSTSAAGTPPTPPQQQDQPPASDPPAALTDELELP